MFGTPIVAFALAEPARRPHGVRAGGERRRARAALHRHGDVLVPLAARKPTRARRSAACAQRRVRDRRRPARARCALDVGRVGAARRGARVARVPPATQARAPRRRRVAGVVGCRVRRAIARRGRVADLERLLSRRAHARARRVFLLAAVRPGARRQSSASGAAGLAREAALDRAARVGVGMVALRRAHGDWAPRRCERARRRARVCVNDDAAGHDARSACFVAAAELARRYAVAIRRIGCRRSRCS